MSLLKKLERRDLHSAAWFDDPTRIPTNGELGLIIPNMPVTQESALRHWAVWACVRTIADPVSTLPVDLLNQVGGRKEPVDPLPVSLRKPGAHTTSIQWRYQVMVSLLLHGNAYGLISARDRLGYPTQVDLISPVGVVVDTDNAGRKVFRIGNRQLTEDSVWHLPGLMLPGELVGSSVIRYFAATIGLGLEVEKFGSDYFRNGLNPTAVFSSDQEVTEEQAKTIKKRAYEAARNREALVTGAGLSLTRWSVNPEESQFLETHRVNAAAIAQIFGVPPEMIGAAVGDGKSITYANREQRAQDFLNNAVNPWLVRLEEALSAWFPRTMFVKFNTGGLLKSDLKTRFDAYSIATGGKPWMLPSEARSFEDWSPVAGIDEAPTPTDGNDDHNDQPV